MGATTSPIAAPCGSWRRREATRRSSSADAVGIVLYTVVNHHIPTQVTHIQTSARERAAIRHGGDILARIPHVRSCSRFSLLCRIDGARFSHSCWVWVVFFRSGLVLEYTTNESE